VNQRLTRYPTNAVGNYGCASLVVVCFAKLKRMVGVTLHPSIFAMSAGRLLTLPTSPLIGTASFDIYNECNWR
jgi:hypothetical protein